MTTPATTVSAADKYTTADDIKKHGETCDSMQIEYFACKMFDFIDRRLKTAPASTIWDHQNLAPYETTFRNECSMMREYGAEIEFDIIPTLRADKYYGEAKPEPTIICRTTVRSYFNDYVPYKNMAARSILENLQRSFIGCGHTPEPTAFAAHTTAFTTYGIAVPYPSVTEKK